MKPLDSVWTEKYRPSLVTEVVGDFKEKILKYLQNPNTIPHFLFHSKAPGTGKCLTGDEMFFTKQGLISFEDYCKKFNINSGYTEFSDSIYDIENSFVKSDYFYKSKSDIIKIVTKRGYELKGTPNHKIKVFDNNGFIWKKLKNINSDDYIPIFYNTNIFGKDEILNYSKFNDIVKKRKKRNFIQGIMIKKPAKLNRDIAFFVGVFIANGLYDNNGINISTHKEWLQIKLLDIAEKNFGIKGHYIKRRKLKKEGISFTSVWLSRFFEYVLKIPRRTSREKVIPSLILKSSEDIQMNFINGLFEDSWISRMNYIEYSTASSFLSKQLQIMLLNLGFFTTHRVKYLEKYKHSYHILTFPVEHSKNFISYFNGYYKNKSIVFKDNMNTNILSYKKIIYNFIKYNRKKYGIKKHDIKIRKLGKLNLIKGSFDRVNRNLAKFITREPYLECLSIIRDNNVFLDNIVSKEYLCNQVVYDFHVPVTHSFLASGIINHNTTLAKCIINELKCDYLILNSSDDRKIDAVRAKVKEFALTKSSKPGLRRAVFLDEFDGMLKASQDALRNVMETYASNVFFILTCNNINKVIEPLKSRCQVIPFSYPEKNDIKEYLKRVCDGESLKYNDEGLTILVDMNYPSIRNCVLALQDLHTDGKEVVKQNVKPINEAFKQLWKLLKDKKWKDIKEAVMATTIDPRELNTFFWENSLNEDNTRLIQLCCRNERDIAFGSDPKIIFVTSLIEMVK